MLSAIGSPLVAGSNVSAMQATQRIRVERAFFLEKVVQPVGAVIEVPKHIARGLIAAGKASVAVEPAPVIEAPVVAEAPADPVPAPEPKGKKHARKQW